MAWYKRLLGKTDDAVDVAKRAGPLAKKEIPTVNLKTHYRSGKPKSPEQMAYEARVAKSNQAVKEQLGPLADVATDFVPGVGEVKDFARAAGDVSSGNYGSAAVNAGAGLLGIVPGIGDVAAKGLKYGAKALGVGADAAKTVGKKAKEIYETEKAYQRSLNQAVPPRPAQSLPTTSTTPAVKTRQPGPLDPLYRRKDSQYEVMNVEKGKIDNLYKAKNKVATDLDREYQALNKARKEIDYLYRGQEGWADRVFGMRSAKSSSTTNYHGYNNRAEIEAAKRQRDAAKRRIESLKSKRDRYSADIAAAKKRKSEAYDTIQATKQEIATAKAKRKGGK